MADTSEAPSGVISDSAFSSECGPLPEVLDGRVDYRDREAPRTAERAWAVSTVDHNHTTPAETEMRKTKPYYPFVKSNLDFTLRHIPNHARALQLLIQYDLGGGPVYNYPPTRCYFDWARTYAPTDPMVMQLGGYYFYKKGDRHLAEKWYLQAVALDPGSAEAHYNLGLFYFDDGDYKSAAEHAAAAYAAGYPLQGLRNKLARVGY